MSHIDTVIVGAGPYGLSLSAHLTAAGIEHEILGVPMLAWRKYMPPGMLLRSEAFASSIHAPNPGYTFEDYCRRNNIAYQPVAMHLPLETFAEYGLWFQRSLVSHLRAADVVNMHRADGIFHLRLSDGRLLTSKRVVLALGLKGFEHTPRSLLQLPESCFSHSAKFGDLSWAENKDITIVGGGQSALGLAALLHEAGAKKVHLLVRDDTVIWNEKPEVARGFVSRLLRPEGGVGSGWRSFIFSEYPCVFHKFSHQRRKRIVQTSWGPSGAWWLRDRVVGKISISLSTEVIEASASDGKANLKIKRGHEISSTQTDHVIAATGFRTDLRRHPFLSKEMIDSLSLDDGVPELTSNFETAIRNFYVIGPASAQSFGPVMRFVYGTKYAAPRVTRHILRSTL